MSSGLLLLVSILAGVVGSVTGLGGGVVLIPFLTAHGVPIKQAIPLSVLSVIVLSTSAASNYVRGHLANLKISAFLEMFAILGALVGASVTVAVQPALLSALCGGTFVIVSGLLWRQRATTWHPSRMPDRFSRTLRLDGSYYDAVERHTVAYHGTRAALSGPLMFVTGVIAGLLGIGSGALTVLIQHVVMDLPPKVAVTTSNLIIGATALAGACVYLEAGLFSVELVVPILLGICAGAIAGSALLVRWSNQRIRRLLLVAIMALGAQILLRWMRGA